MKILVRLCAIVALSIISIGNLCAATPHWTCDTYAYQYDMTVYYAIAIDGTVVEDMADYELAAFCGDECRGTGKVMTAEYEGQTTTYGYLRIRSNQQEGETITFKVYQQSTGTEMNVYNTSITFLSQQLMGMPSSPMTLPVVHFTVAVSCDETMGTVSGSGRYEANSQVVVAATPSEGYHFTKWSDGSEANPYEFTVTKDVELTAQFTVNTYAVIYMVNGVEWQRDLVDYGQPIVLRDYTPAEGYRFEGWTSDADYETMPAHDVVYTAVITLDRIKGDVNGDGAVDIADVVAVYNIMAGKNTNGFNGDVNEDGAVDIADVVAIYNIMAGKQ